MFLKSKIKLEERKKFLVYIGGAAQIALVASIFLSRLDLPGFDFLEGMLLGFSIVGNLAFLVSINRKTRGGRND